jgi:hypothetical protein
VIIIASNSHIMTNVACNKMSHTHSNVIKHVALFYTCSYALHLSNEKNRGCKLEMNLQKLRFLEVSVPFPLIVDEFFLRNDIKTQLNVYKVRHSRLYSFIFHFLFIFIYLFFLINKYIK